MKSDGHVSVERTAKRYKLLLLLSGLGMIVGVFWILGAVAYHHAMGVAPDYIKPVAVLAISGFVRIITKFLIWWNHG